MNEVIIVTGGAGGIGSDLCRGLAGDGLKVLIADYAKDAAEKVAAEIRQSGGEASAIQVDVGNPQSVAAMMDQSIAQLGAVDYVFCGAGVMDRIAVVDMPEEEWDRVMRINLKGVFLCSQAAARHMIPKKKGRITTSPSTRSAGEQPTRRCRGSVSRRNSSKSAKKFRRSWTGSPRRTRSSAWLGIC